MTDQGNPLSWFKTWGPTLVLLGGVVASVFGLHTNLMGSIADRPTKDEVRSILRSAIALHDTKPAHNGAAKELDSIRETTHLDATRLTRIEAQQGLILQMLTELKRDISRMKRR